MGYYSLYRNTSLSTYSGSTLRGLEVSVLVCIDRLGVIQVANFCPCLENDVCLSFFFFSKKINLTELSYMFSSVWVGFRCECFFSVHWDLPFFLSNVPGRFSRQWNKKVSFDDFSKVPLFACWNGNILEYIGVKFPPYITKIVPTGARWSWCTR